MARVEFWRREYFSTGYKIAFLNAVLLRIQAGESVGRALVSVIQSEKNPNKKRELSAATDALDQGDAVWVAFEVLDFFDRTVLAILKAGERSGMAQAIETATAHLTVRQAWFKEHLLVIFILANEMFSAAVAPLVLHQEILPWIRQHISPPNTPEALLRYETDMVLAEQMTLGLIGLVFCVVVFIAWAIYQIRQLKAPNPALMFFADGAMGVGFKLASAMLKAGVTIEQVASQLAYQSPGWSRRFWTAVHAQLEKAVEPALALQQLGLYPEEASLLVSHANAKQLGATFQVLADERERRAKRGRDLLLILGTLLTVGFIILCLGIAIWIYMTYDNTLSAGLEALGKGF